MYKQGVCVGHSFGYKFLRTGESWKKDASPEDARLKRAAVFCRQTQRACKTREKHAAIIVVKVYNVVVLGLKTVHVSTEVKILRFPALVHWLSDQRLSRGVQTPPLTKLETCAVLQVPTNEFF